MPRNEPLNIRLAGSAFEPTGPAWAKASPARRLDYWKHLAEFALDVKRQEIRKGIGVDGKKFKPVKPTSRPDGATGPPLIPHFGGSRTATLLAATHTASGCTLFWRAHGRVSWAKILGYHAYKHGPRSLPVRNTIGISPAGIKKLVRNSRDWWDLTSKPKPPMPKPPSPPPPPPPPPVPKPKAKSKSKSKSTEVVYLKPGQKPDPLSKKIQVYTTTTRKPKGGSTPEPPKPTAPDPKPPKKPTPPASAKPKPVPKPTPTPTPTPTLTPAKPPTFADEMRPRVDAEVKRLVGEFAAAKRRLEAAEARWSAAKSSPTVKPTEWEAAQREQRAALKAAAEVAEQGKRFERWRKDVKTNPDLIPPFDVQERLRIYSERGGAEKLKRLQALGSGDSELARIEAELEAKRKEYYGMRSSSPKKGQVGEELLKLNKQRHALLNGEAISPPVEKIVAAIRPGKTIAVEADLADYEVKRGIVPVADQLRPVIDEGLDYVRQVVSAAGLPPLKVRVGMVAKGAPERSFCNLNGIALEEGVKARVFVHEFGHHLDDTVGAGAAVDFLKYRVKDEPLQKLKDVIPGSGYGPGELGRKDRFEEAFGERAAWYVGKEYLHPASEITSMGMEQLFTDPVRFAHKDPEYCSFILGILDGALR